MNSYVGKCLNSTCFDCNDANGCQIVHNNRIQHRIANVKLGKNGVKNVLLENEKEDLMYFAMEVDLVANSVRFLGEPFAHNFVDAIFDIRQFTKPFRIGLSIWGKARNSIGLGIVNTGAN